MLCVALIPQKYSIILENSITWTKMLLTVSTIGNKMYKFY